MSVAEDLRKAVRRALARGARGWTAIADTYCEMGIDVRAYAMANMDVKRASCVGCGMCAHVCPRGVLKLEGKADRFEGGTPIRVYAGDL